MGDQNFAKNDVGEQPIADKELKDCLHCRHYRMAALEDTEVGMTIRCYSSRPTVRRVVFDSGLKFDSEKERAEAKPHQKCPYYRPPAHT